MTFQVIVVIGAICSGKDHFADQYPNAYEKIRCGDIIRKLTKTQERICDKNLDLRLIDGINKQLNDAFKSPAKIGAVIVGIRTMDVLNAIESICDDREFELVRIYLEVPYHILKQRFEKRAAEKDLKYTLDEALQKDVELGYPEVLQYLKLVNTSIVHNY